MTPVSAEGDRYDWANLASLCSPCHLTKTLAEAVAAPKWIGSPTR
ncbi:HNH endonuclease [Nocardia brasiliensis]